MRHPVRLLAILAVAVFSWPALLSAQQESAVDQRQAFFDEIQAPNWLGTDIEHTSIKRQSGGSCWSFSTVAFLESEVLRTNADVVGALEEAKAELDLSEYYIVYWAYVEKAREYARRKGENARFTDGGLSHDVTWLVEKYGIVPEADFAVVEDYGAMRTDLNAVLEAHAESGDWTEDVVVSEIRAVLDRHLAPPPETIVVAGRTMTPVEYATEYLDIEPAGYWEITSYTDMPFYGRGELDVPDNWWDYDGYYNLPLDEYMQTINRALDAGYPVVIDTDWGDKGASWNGAGLAVMHSGPAHERSDRPGVPADRLRGRTNHGRPPRAGRGPPGGGRRRLVPDQELARHQLGPARIRVDPWRLDGHAGAGVYGAPRRAGRECRRSLRR